MITYLQHLSCWDWLVLATLLLILEIFGTGGYLLWTSMMAISIGTLTYFFPELSWLWQFFLFATLALFSTLLWRLHQYRVGKTKN